MQLRRTRPSRFSETIRALGAATATLFGIHAH
jgi:hypothetical protein